MWDLANDRPICSLRGHEGIVNSVAFNPDGTRLASGSADNTVKVWDVLSCQEVRTLKGHSEPVLSVAFSPDGTHLASGSADRTVKLYDARPLTPEVRLEREARLLVETLFEQSRLKSNVIPRIEGHRAITEAVRQKALEFVKLWPEEVKQE